MNAMSDRKLSTEERLVADESGIFTWDLHSNILYADTAVAKLFGLPPAETIAGLPLQSYIARVLDDDKASLAKAISHAVMSGEPYHEEYRVFDAIGAVKPVMAFGRCFRNAEGVPFQYAGIIFPVTENVEDPDPLLSHVAIAHGHAVESGRTMVAEALEGILSDLIREPRTKAAGAIH